MALDTLLARLRRLAGQRVALLRTCEDCGARVLLLVTKGDHHGGRKTVCRDRAACHRRSPA